MGGGLGGAKDGYQPRDQDVLDRVVVGVADDHAALVAPGGGVAHVDRLGATQRPGKQLSRTFGMVCSAQARPADVGKRLKKRRCAPCRDRRLSGP